MKKISTSMFASLTAIACVASFAAIAGANDGPDVDPAPAGPSGATAISESYGNASASNTSFSFNKYLVMDQNTQVPNVDFTFTIVPAGIETAHLTDAKVELYNGLTKTVGDTSYPAWTDGTAAFTDESTTTPGGTNATFTNNKGGSSSIGITSDTSKKYAKDELILDFSNIEFTEPGVYRYTVTENDLTTSATSDAFTALTPKSRTLDVYVGNTDTLKENSTYTTLQIEGYVLYDSVIEGAATNFTTDEAAAAGIGYRGSETSDEALGKKSSGFVNDYETHNLTFGKEVTGNQGSKDKYFAFTVNLEDAVPGDKFTVAVEKSEENVGARVFANADATVAANAATTVSGPNVKLLEADASGKVDQTFYLHDGQYITICGLGKGVKYNITEAAEDYTSTPGILATNSSLDWTTATDNNDALDDGVQGTIAADVHTGYTNSRSGVIPTGVILSVAAPATIGIVVVGGIIYLAAKRRKDDEDED